MPSFQNVPSYHGSNLDSAHLQHQKSSTPRFLILPKLNRFHNQTTNHQTHWSAVEIERYSLFVCYFAQDFLRTEHQPTNWEIYQGLSKFIGSRNPNQCRIFHSKCVRNTLGVQNLLNRIKSHSIFFRLKRQQANLQAAMSGTGRLLKHKSSNICLSHPSIAEISEEDEEKQTGKPQNDKKDEDNRKTADDYQEGQKEDLVKGSFLQNRQDTNKFGVGVGLEENSSATFYAKPVKKRSSLPSFADEESESDKQKRADFNRPSMQSSNGGLHGWEFPNRDIIQSEPIIPVSLPLDPAGHFREQKLDKGSVERLGSAQTSSEKNNQLLDCLFMMQMWMSKLQKVLRESQPTSETRDSFK